MCIRDRNSIEWFASVSGIRRVSQWRKHRKRTQNQTKRVAIGVIKQAAAKEACKREKRSAADKQLIAISCSPALRQQVTQEQCKKQQSGCRYRHPEFRR